MAGVLDWMFSSPQSSAFLPQGDGAWSPNAWGYGARTLAGIAVSEDGAMLNATALRCSRLIIETLANLPLKCYKKTKSREQVTADTVPAVRLLQGMPNSFMSAGVYRETQLFYQVNFGSAFSEIVRDGRSNRIIELHPIATGRVSPAKADSGFDYAVREANGQHHGFHRDEMLHACGALSPDGIWGRGVVAQIREAIGAALATERHGAAYFGSGAQPKGVLSMKGMMGDAKKATREQMRREWREMHGSPESSEIVIVGEDTTYLPITVSNSDNQFIEAQVRLQEMICNAYGIPQYMLGARAAGTSIEAMSNEFIIYGLYPWASKIEQQLGWKTLEPAQRADHYWEHDFAALLRGDVQTRMNAYRVGIAAGIYTLNHCKRLENLPDIGPAGDETYLPANMVTADRMLETGSGSGGTPGSDHTGAPADNPLDHEPKAMSDSAFDAARRELPKTEAANLKATMAALEKQLQDRPTDWREAARSCLVDVLRRMATKESQAALTALDKRADFAAWVREFYAKHEATMEHALESACFVLRLAGVAKWSKPGDLAAWLKAKSVEEMMQMHARDSKESRLRKLAAWPTDRVARVIDEVMG